MGGVCTTSIGGTGAETLKVEVAASGGPGAIERAKGDSRMGCVWNSCAEDSTCDLIRMSFYDAYTGSMKFTTQLDDISHCKITSGTNWSDRRTYRVRIIHTRRD